MALSVTLVMDGAYVLRHCTKKKKFIRGIFFSIDESEFVSLPQTSDELVFQISSTDMPFEWMEESLVSQQ